MPHIVTINDFSGPMDLLLQLVVEKKRDITHIALAEVTDQYLVMIAQAGDAIDPAEISDFLLVASRLLYIKSRVLLPHLTLSDEDDVTDLTLQLRLYREFAESAKKINKMFERGYRLYENNPAPNVIETKFRPADNTTGETLSLALNKLIELLKPIVRIPKALIEKTVTLQQKIIALKNLIAEHISVSFRSHVASHDVRDQVVSFIAVLELVKQHMVLVEQNDLFADIIITRK